MKTKVNVENLDVPRILGAIETIRELFDDAGVDSSDVDVQIWLKGVDNQQMTEIGETFQKTDKYTRINQGHQGKVSIVHHLENFSIHGLEED